MKRKDFIRNTAYSLFGVSALGQGMGKSIKPDPSSKVKSVIYIYLQGGMSHLDSFDPKENEEIKGTTNAIGTNVPGIQISEHLPKLAAIMDKIAIVRSMSSTAGAHKQGQYIARTSYQLRGSIIHPALGAWAASEVERETELPGYVLISGPSNHPGAGYLPKKFSPLPIVDPNRGLANAKTDPKLTERLELLSSVNKTANVKQPKVAEYVQFYDETLKLLNSSELNVFDLNKVDSKRRNDYGMNKIGQGCLLAKRLVKQGITFVEVENGGWDTHVNNFDKLTQKLPEVDTAVAALVADLESEGLLDSTLIAIATEFGRTPKINTNTGRDHHPAAYSSVLIGGGIKGGVVYGETDDKGQKVKKNKVTPQDFNATIGSALGLPIEKEVFSPTGRPFHIAGKGSPIKDILL